MVVELDLDGTGRSTIDTGVPFFDHMLAQLAKHGGLDLVVATRGDLAVDAHHTVEDTSLALGQALNEALGDRAGLRRFGDALVPLDECLVQSAVDLSGRPYLVHEEPRAGRADRLVRHDPHPAHLGVDRGHVAGHPARAGAVRAQRPPRRGGAVQVRGAGPCATPSPSTRGSSGVPSTKGTLTGPTS